MFPSFFKLVSAFRLKKVKTKKNASKKVSVLAVFISKNRKNDCFFVNENTVFFFYRNERMIVLIVENEMIDDENECSDKKGTFT